jgi:LacI family transcriptional regulator
MNSAKRTTIIDVGRLAGVSTKTVSRVLNGEPHVREELRKRVREAADELGYHPNVLAQALVRQRSHLIGLVFEKPSPSYVVELQMGVIDRLQEGRYRLVVIPIGSTTEHADEVIGLVRSAALDGVVLAPPVCDHPRILGDLTKAGIRFTRIVPTSALELSAYTSLDEVAAAKDAAQHLIELGHRRIAVICGDPTHAATNVRLTGYRLAFAEAGLTLSDSLIESGLFTFDSGMTAGRRLLARPDRPTAILAQNDDMAVGALMAAHEIGLRLPDDLSVVGFDDSEISRISWPPLTTVQQPVFDMARSAADMLIADLEGTPRPDCQVHSHRLIIRGSTVPPPAGA